MSPCDVKALQACLRRTNGDMQKVCRIRLRTRLVDATAASGFPFGFMTSRLTIAHAAAVPQGDRRLPERLQRGKVRGE